MAERGRLVCRTCRARLVEPTDSDRRAFCCRGCWNQHYRRHCWVCDRPTEPVKILPDGQPRQNLCKLNCRRIFNANKIAFGPMLGIAAITASQTQQNQAFFRVIAGGNPGYVSAASFRAVLKEDCRRNPLSSFDRNTLPTDLGAVRPRIAREAAEPPPADPGGNGWAIPELLARCP